MENSDSFSKINIKLILLEIFPSLEELNNNNSEIITISFQDKDNDILYNLNDLLSSKKEIDLTFSSNTSNIKMFINKNDILYASGLLPLKNGDQWITFLYENKKKVNSNLALSLMDCIKLKIQCRIISGNESLNLKEINFKKKNKTVLNHKKKEMTRKLNLNQLTQDSLNADESKKNNRYNETNVKTQTPNAHTTINKNSIKKIELSVIKSNKLNNRKVSNFNYTTVRNGNLKNITFPQKVQKFTDKKYEDGEMLFVTTEAKPKMKKRGDKGELEDMHLNLNLKHKTNKSSQGIKMENSKSSKMMKKRRSEGMNNIIENLYDINNEINTNKNNNKKNETKNKKKKSSDNMNLLKKLNDKNSSTKSSRMNKIGVKNVAQSCEIPSNNNIKLINIINGNKNINIQNNENEINHDVEKIQDDNIINTPNDLDFVEDEEIENNIFSKQLEDFKLLYSDEFIKSITNEYIKLEFELYIEKVIELTTLYNNQIEEKNFEYQILKNNYYKNIFQYVEILKMFNKLNLIKTKYELKKNNLKEINFSQMNNSINNLITNKKQIKLFKNNFIDEKAKREKNKKELGKQIIKKLIEKEKIKNILERNEKFKKWIKNCLKKEDKKKKEKINNQKNKSKKEFSTNNKKLNTHQDKSTKNKTNKISNQDKLKNKKKK